MESAMSLCTLALYEGSCEIPGDLLSLVGFFLDDLSSTRMPVTIGTTIFSGFFHCYCPLLQGVGVGSSKDSRNGTRHQ